MRLAWTIVILLAVNAATIGAMLLVRRRAPEGSRFQDGDRASGVFGVLAGGSRSSPGSSSSWPSRPTTSRADGHPAVRDRAEGGDTINPWAIALFRSLQLVNPKSASEQAAYSKWLDQTSDREAGRSDRLHGAEGIIPTSIWLVLFLVAGVVFIFMLFFADSGEGAGAQAMLMGSATTVIVLTLAAINALNHPYSAGVGQIKPVAMQRSLRILDSARTVLNVRAPVPCDARGARVSS
jgi:hypothetical protein